MDNKLLRACLAELIGTFALVFVGAGVVCVANLTGEPRLDAAAIAFAEGLTLAVALTTTLRGSGGGLNPALTLMLWVFRRIDGNKLVGFVVGQLIGGDSRGVVSASPLHSSRLDRPLPRYAASASVSLRTASRLAGIFSGIGVETFFTCLVAFAFYATLLDRRSPPLGGLMVGLAQTAVVLFGFRLTGGAANPARWLGTVVWEMTLTHSYNPLADHTVYWVGPIIGALLGGFLYIFVMQPPEEEVRLEKR